MGERGANDDGGDRQLAVGNIDKDRWGRRQALEGGTMAEVSSNVSGVAVVNGTNSGGGQGLRRTMAGVGGGGWGM